MGTILSFRPRTRPTRLHALRWLSARGIAFPGDVGIGPEVFFGWRFIRGLDGVVYFADCVHAGITAGDVEQFLRKSS